MLEETIKYITNNVKSQLNLEERITIFKMILTDNVSKDNFIRKRTGTEIKFKYMSEALVLKIEKYIQECIERKQKELDSLIS